MKIILNERQINVLCETKYIGYHGSNVEFDDFDFDKIGSEHDNWHGAGFYFSSSKNESGLYGSIIKKYQLELKNPIDFTHLEDTSVQGSGFVRFVANLKGFANFQYKGRTLKEIVEILNNLEEEFNEKNISYSDGTRDYFKHVWYQRGNKEYVLRNRNQNEIDNKNYIKSLFIDQILRDFYKIESLPIMVKDLTNPFVFSKVAMKNGYDGIIAPNSLMPNGEEYVVFNKNQIKKLDQ